MRKILMLTAGVCLLGMSCLLQATELSKLDKKMIEVQKKMISLNKRFKVGDIKILKKKSIDERWKMYTFDIALTDIDKNKKFNTPMIIFTDGEYETNTLMNIETGVRYEVEEQRAMRQKSKSQGDIARETFEKTFKLDGKYYNKKHLISGDINSKNKIIIISDPLCVACIGMFPSVFNGLKNKKDVAIFYYHFPLKKLHPTAETVSKAIALAKSNGIKNVELKVYEADFNKLYNVYKSKDKQNALNEFNKIFNTKYTLAQVEKQSLEFDMSIGKEVRLRGTPTIIVNGSLQESRKKLSVLMMVN